MNLNAMFVTIFCVIGIFAVIFGLIPSGFFANQAAYTEPTQQAKEVASYFSANNMTLYNVSWSGNITFPQVIQNQTNLPDGHYIEIHWETFFTDADGSGPAIQFRHVSPGSILWIIPSPFPDWEVMTVEGMEPYPVGSTVSETWFFLYEEDETARFSASCSHAMLNIVFFPINSSYPTLQQSWNIGSMRYLVSYGIDFDAMKPGAWTLMSQLMTFQDPDFGVPGDGGIILNYVIAAAIWACIVLLIYAAVTSVIPTISGWTGG